MYNNKVSKDGDTITGVFTVKEDINGKKNMNIEGTAFFGALYYGTYSGTHMIVPYSEDNEIKLFNYKNTYMEVGTANHGAFGIDWYSSDKRLKKNIENSTIHGLDVIRKIRHVSFDWNDDKKAPVKVGYIAQELQEIDNDMVFSVTQPQGSEYDELLQISLNRIIPYITKAIQELADKVDSIS